MNSKLLKIPAAATAIVLVVAAAGVWWFFRGDPVDEVSLETATESVGTTAVDDASDTNTNDTNTNDTNGADAAAVDLNGTWTVDTTTGDFDYQSATSGFLLPYLNKGISGERRSVSESVET